MFNNNKIWIGFAFLSIFFFINCSERKSFSQQNDLKPEIDSNVNFIISKSSIEIANDTNDIILAYFTFSNNVDSQKIIYLTKKYFINIVDVTNHSVTKTNIPVLLKEAIEKSKPFVQFCQINDSEYFFLLKDTLVRWNTRNSELIFKKVILPRDYNTVEYSLSINLVQEFGLPMYFKNDTLRFGSFLIHKKQNKWSMFADNYPYQVNYSIKDSNSFTSKFRFPTFINENHYGLGFEIHRLNILNYDIISLPFSSNIYRVSTINNMVDTIGGKSKYQTSDFIKPLSSKHQMNQISSDSEWYYYIHTEKYSQLIYNSNTKQYYRLYYHHIPLKKSDGLYYTHKDRVISLQVFNEQFSLVHEEILDDIWFVLHFLPYKNGFLINNNGIDPKKENYEYLYYKVFSK
jgi:hypothetical protein